MTVGLGFYDTIEYVLFCCVNHDECRAQLKDVVDVTTKSFVYSKAHMLIAPNSSAFVTKYENHTLKEALFQFSATIDRKT